MSAPNLQQQHAYLESLSEMYILRPRPRPNASETLGETDHYMKQDFQVTLMRLNVQKPLDYVDIYMKLADGVQESQWPNC